ncbi:MAG: anthranilate phosphoribosyltransferase [Bacteroidetes bacterium CG12_big_fil_rev_8_21_14_0_65_60_17]|nr:MAG: anthranilate phosphoribosyltransferase [Bacteroidetes bacterium CG12_big_fil_rev_8_21_14_0_65_60_17]
MHDILTRIAEHTPLTREDAVRAMELILRGDAEAEQIAAFLLGLRGRGETFDELAGLTSAMRSFATQVVAPAHALDIVGTGGDRSGTFNISTTAAFVCAGAGATIAKHGNRSVSSKSGASDVLEALGLRTELGKEGVEYCLREADCAFLFAPFFHPALKHVMPVRRKLGVRTCFNILGPMCNPAGVRRYLVGAFTKDIARLMAQILAELGAERVITAHAHDGLDEISLSGPTTIYRVDHVGADVVEQTVYPFDYGLQVAPLSAVQGGNAAENARISRDILDGKKGAPRDIVLLNAGFALVVAGLAETPGEGVRLAAESIDSGRARAKLDQMVAVTQEAP